MKRISEMVNIVSVCVLLVASLLVSACAKQQPTDPPGKAAITNIKTSLTVGQIAIATASAALPAFKLDKDDSATAMSILSDIGKARGTFAQRLAPYDHFDTANAEEIKQIARDAIATLKDLHDNGVDHIKNPDARQQVSAAIDAVQALADSVIAMQAPAPA